MLGIYESPRQLYDELARRGFDVKPLSRGHFGGVEFDNGGGFKVNYGGDGILQYHPKEYSRYGGAYYKVSNGKNGTRRYTMGGDLIVRNVSKNNK
ncbi:hypothetical protein IJI17_02810 [Candidatus Saccharibacteria bacterium]|nr:hypothetical protein [Candidatus Saccharibacteria bacterium]